MANVVVIDYGMGNLKSVQRGLEKAGAKVTVTAHPDYIAAAERLILPGVGAFEDGMKGIGNAGVIAAIDAFVQTGRPLLGICLGMQMLFAQSEEHGLHDGLGYIPGLVAAIPKEQSGKLVRKTPHIGWSALQIPSQTVSWEGTILDGNDEGNYCYFVHSYMAIPESRQHLLASCDYEGIEIAAAVKKDNITGVQFHPEKSGSYGLQILQEFVRL